MNNHKSLSVRRLIRARTGVHYGRKDKTRSVRNGGGRGGGGGDGEGEGERETAERKKCGAKEKDGVEEYEKKELRKNKNKNKNPWTKRRAGPGDEIRLPAMARVAPRPHAVVPGAEVKLSGFRN